MTKNLFNVAGWILVGLMVLYAAYFKGWIFADFQSISAQEAHTLLQHPDNIVLLDVRSPAEYKEEHIARSFLIPLPSLESSIDLLQPFKEKRIIVYCRSGNRSVAASRILQEHGYQPLNLSGGIGEWKRAGFDIER